MKIRLPYATVLLNRGVFAGFLPSLYSTRFVGFSCPCAAAGTAAAVAAAAATAPRLKNFRRFVVLIVFLALCSRQAECLPHQTSTADPAWWRRRFRLRLDPIRAGRQCDIDAALRTSAPRHTL